MIDINNETWIRCQQCGHKLLRVIDAKGSLIEIKCHSCKAINEIVLTNKGGGLNEEST